MLAQGSVGIVLLGCSTQCKHLQANIEEREWEWVRLVLVIGLRFIDGSDKILRKLKMSITTEHDCILRLVPASNSLVIAIC